MTTIVMMGGSSSGATDNMHLLVKCIHAVRHYEQNNKDSDQPKFPTKLRVVLLPHLAGSIREVDGVDPVKEKTFAHGAQILKKAIDDPANKLRVTDKVGLVGASAGGAQLTELAALLGDRCSFLALADSVGMAENLSLVPDFVIGSFVDVFTKYLDKKVPPLQAIKLGIQDIFKGISTRQGNLQGLRDLLKDFTNPLRKQFNATTAGAWSAKTAGEYNPIDIMKADSTAAARQTIESPIIFSPVLYSKVANSLLTKINERMKSKIKPKDLKGLVDSSQENSQDLKTMVGDILQKMFPKVLAEDMHLLPYEEKNHSSYVEQTYWDPLMDEVGKILK